ncbi:adhesion G protein-coupled receptor E5 isoform X3 [Physeter macrocephalus]|uniref:Adhesion G protein-coupled receptor E5 n=1 Tax=Physeter macrocephalus TaxID=9755 RepID=A0A2Y9FUR4_PHYMC|nr:adhesion G protein-coupled receptor E5 isoform X3 [Physeter catodon]|eukprot:XP_007129485.1 CD97 antigen isoform X3 [Physeter catodon]
MGGPYSVALFVFHVLCVLLTLSEAGSQNTMACAPWCPANSSCASGTTCRCTPGFNSSSGEIFTDPLESCDDINECGPPMTVSCGKLADCQNTEGGYHCMCSPGYELISGATMFQNESENTCQDMDECSSGQHQCHNSTICLNTVGSYTCHCRRGWVPKPGFQDKQMGTISCEEISFPTWTAPPEIKSQSLSGFFERVQKMSIDFKSALTQETIQYLIMSVDDLLKTPGDLEALDLSSRHHTATYLFSGLEQILRTLAKAMSGGSFIYHSPGDTELSLMVQEQGSGNITVGQSHARMLLDWAVAAGAEKSGPTVVGLLSSPNMQKLLANASLDLDLEKQTELEEIYESPVRGAQLRLLSAVNLVFLSNTNTDKLNSKVTFAFSHPWEMPGTRQELICAFWKSDSNRRGYWATSGCQTLGSRNGSTTCQCNHLSSFAILMAHYDVEDWKLALITKVGLALSLVCLLLCILTFLLVRPIQGSRTTVHLHLCICLFVGSTVFLTGIENEGGQIGLRCRLVAGLLHYCFLAAFCWMSLEGVELYFLVVRVFQGQGLRKRWLCLIGYGVPLFIVAVSAAIKSQGYGRPQYCWLDHANGFLWSFLGPVTFITLCNAVIFVITLWKLTQKFSEINPDIKKLKKARVLTITAIAQLFVLGCTWVFGLFLFDQRSWVLCYIFSILNCLQGLFLFVLYCLLNKKVREEYRRWACMVTRNKYSEFATSTSGSGSSQSQTRALRPSESGM